MADLSDLPTIVIKVNISCCNACRKKLTKLLTKTDGVASFDINEEEGLVEIKGDADPQVLVRNISKSLNKKKTQLVHYELPKEKSPPKEPEKEEDTSKGSDITEHAYNDVEPSHYYYYPYHQSPPPPMQPQYGYEPPAPPPPPQYSNGASSYFSDENSSGCAIM